MFTRIRSNYLTNIYTDPTKMPTTANGVAQIIKEINLRENNKGPHAIVETPKSSTASSSVNVSDEEFQDSMSVPTCSIVSRKQNMDTINTETQVAVSDTMEPGKSSNDGTTSDEDAEESQNSSKHSLSPSLSSSSEDRTKTLSSHELLNAENKSNVDNEKKIPDNDKEVNLPASDAINNPLCSQDSLLDSVDASISGASCATTVTKLQKNYSVLRSPKLWNRSSLGDDSSGKDGEATKNIKQEADQVEDLQSEKSHKKILSIGSFSQNGSENDAFQTLDPKERTDDETYKKTLRKVSSILSHHRKYSSQDMSSHLSTFSNGHSINSHSITKALSLIHI